MVTLKILYINPIGSDVVDRLMLDTIHQVKRPDVGVEVVHLKEGPDHLEYHFHEHLNTGETLEWVRRAEREGYDAVVIGCFYDTGLREAREIVSIPVVGPAEATMHVAATLGHRFSVIVGRRKWVPKIEDNARAYGVDSKIASFRPIGKDVPELRESPKKVADAILREARRAIEEDGAEVIVLGCTGYTALVADLMGQLGAPILDAVSTSWKYAEMMAELYRRFGLSHSKLFAFETPPPLPGLEGEAKLT